MSAFGNETTTYNKSIHDHRVESASAYTMVTLSDTEDLTFVDLAGEYADHRLNKAYCRGFHANTNGTVVVVGPGNLDERSQVALKVVAGTKYDYGVRRFKLTGSTFGDSSTWKDHIVAWR
jgi:hypothetical protein